LQALCQNFARVSQSTITLVADSFNVASSLELFLSQEREQQATTTCNRQNAAGPLGKACQVHLGCRELAPVRYEGLIPRLDPFLLLQV
jgi:hypothetical protein